MARRESQGLQITLIVFVMLTVILAVTTYIFWSGSQKLKGQVAALQTESQTMQNARNTAVDENIKLKVFLGYAGDTPVAEIENQFNKDMQTYAGSLPDVQRTYKDLPAHLMATIQNRHQAIANLTEQVNRLTTDLENVKQQAQQEVAEAKRVQAETDANLRKTRDEFTAERSRINQEKGQLAQQIDETRTALSDLTSKTDQQIRDLEKTANNYQMIIQNRDDQLRELTTTTFEVPDGKVTWVNPKTGIVYVNLGSADQLRSQVTFSVYGVDVNNLARGEKKGSIEITRVSGNHFSEARITEDDPTDPILPGDQIYTPLWNSKSALRFALAGVMDVNGDGRDDRDLIKRMITLNNGSIDAEEANGEIVGEITTHTRYLVRGEPPEVAAQADETSNARQKAWSQIMQQASEMGVEVMSVEKLLDFVGFDGEKRVIPLGRDARSEDFKAAPDDGVLRRSTGNVFREDEARSDRRSAY